MSRVARLVIINAPYWFGSAWGMVARVLPSSVQQKITIMSGVEGLRAFIPLDQTPQEYGGTSGPLGQAIQHMAFLKLAQDWKVRLRMLNI